MDKVLNWVKAAFAAIGGVIGWFFGLADGFLYALIAFVVMHKPIQTSVSTRFTGR